MVRQFSAGLSTCALAVVTTVAACGGGDSGSIFDSSGGTGGSAGGGLGGGNPLGSSGNSGGTGTGTPGTGVPGSTSNTELLDGSQACASSTKAAQLTPVEMVIIYDKSGSMGDNGGAPNLEKRWVPVNAGMKAFFTDPGSSGLSASLTFFPVDGDLTTACTGPYDAPVVPLTSLSNSAPFLAALDNTMPYGGTPTLPALQGSINYGNALRQQTDEAEVIVVLVTDGQPGFLLDTGMIGPGCDGNDVDHVVAAAGAAFQATPPTKTYVIGVGPSLDALNAIAAAGGTGQAMMIPVDDPTQTKIQIQQSLSSIRTLSLTCNVSIPPPPDGALLDTGLVNVIYTNSANGKQVLGYSPDCADGNGWEYDNPSAPTHVKLCANTCAAAQGDTSGRLEILFGCARVNVIR
jgi:hypothetical protein